MRIVHRGEGALSVQQDYTGAVTVTMALRGMPVPSMPAVRSQASQAYQLPVQEGWLLLQVLFFPSMRWLRRGTPATGRLPLPAHRRVEVAGVPLKDQIVWNECTRSP